MYPSDMWTSTSAARPRTRLCPPTWWWFLSGRPAPAPKTAPPAGTTAPTPPTVSYVLFNFPLRYLSTLALVPVFSLRWSVPPTLGCIHKQPDSGRGPHAHTGKTISDVRHVTSALLKGHDGPPLEVLKTSRLTATLSSI